jgi:hypothetical protein
LEDAGHLQDGRFVDRNEAGVVGGGADNSAVDHAGQGHIVDEAGSAGDFLEQVEADGGLADGGVGFGGFGLGEAARTPI